MSNIIGLLLIAVINLSCKKEEDQGHLIAPRIVVSNPVPCIGEEVEFYYRTDVPGTALWRFGDGGTSNSVTSKHVFTEEKKYKVVLEFSDKSGKKVTSSIDVEVIGKRLTDELLRLVKTPSEIWITAHRANTDFGIKNGIPENSLAAIHKAIEVGANVIEVDVRETSDGNFVLMHDASLNRTTNTTGNVKDRTLQQLKTFRLRDANGTITDHTIPTLEEALLAGRGKVFFCLDKTTDGVTNKGKLLALISSIHMLDRVFFYLSSTTAASQLKAANQRSNIFPWASEIATINSWAVDPSINIVHLAYKAAGDVAGVVAHARSKNMVTYANSLNDLGDTDMLKGNFSFISTIKNLKIQVVSTDYVELLKEKL